LITRKEQAGNHLDCQEGHKKEGGKNDNFKKRNHVGIVVRPFIDNASYRRTGMVFGINAGRLSQHFSNTGLRYGQGVREDAQGDN
jgi:hypothetical protein